MKRSDRLAAEKLEAVINKHRKQTATLDVAAIIDLETVGFHFNNIGEAYMRLEAQRRYPGFTQSQIDIVLYQEQRSNRRAMSA